MRDIIIHDRYRIDAKLGSGGFGLVYAGTDLVNGDPVAIKLQRGDIGRPISYADREAEVYEALGATAGSRRRSPEGFSRLRDSLSQGQYEILVMDRLGPSIIDLTKYMREEPFTVGTVCMIGRQAIRRIRTLHNKGILHMDIKPHNMLMGTGKNGNTLYVTDFGTSHRHDERRTFLHRSRHPEQYELGPNDNNPNVNTWRVPSPFLGTDWFASLNVHRLRGYTYADDLESLCYSFVYLLTTTLPWRPQSVEGEPSPMQNEGIANKKETMTPEEICTGLEPEFARFLTYVRSVPLGSKPNYNYLLRLLDTAWRRGGSGNVWDWTRYRYGELLSETDPSGSQDGESDGSRTRSWTRN